MTLNPSGHSSDRLPSLARMLPVRRCEFCNRRLRRTKRLDARFCSDRCRVACRRRASREVHIPQSVQRVVPARISAPSDDSKARAPSTPEAPRPAGPLERLARTLLSHAPRDAAGYRLGDLFRIPGRGAELWFYPPSERASLRADGTRIQRCYFLLDPFDVPVVPCAGCYGVEYVDADGALLPAVPALLAGVSVELPDYLIQIEEGDRRSLS